MTFEELNLTDSVLEGLQAMNFKNPTPIQEQAIPIILQDHDLIACAQTGTGKTAAYLLPILHKIEQKDYEEGGISTLIIVPTRELAIQIEQSLAGLAYFTDVNYLAMYGGTGGESFVRETNALKTGLDILVSTPGKMIAHLNMGYVPSMSIKNLILDEADKMLDMGFFDDIMKIINQLPKKEDRQTLLFSATMPDKIRKLTKEILIDPQRIDIAIAKPAEGITQGAFLVYEHQKVSLILEILKRYPQMESVIIFCNRKTEVNELNTALKRKGILSEGIQSDLEQSDREQIIRDFKNKQFNVLIGTDIIARGLDVKGIDLVINYQAPQDADDYVHRIGRTARAKTKGLAFTLIGEKEQQKFFGIEKTLDIKVTRLKIPESLGEAPSVQEPRTQKRTKKKHYTKKNYKRRK